MTCLEQVSAGCALCCTALLPCSEQRSWLLAQAGWLASQGKGGRGLGSLSACALLQGFAMLVNRGLLS
jgi:hypothetical protein